MADPTLHRDRPILEALARALARSGAFSFTPTGAVQTTPPPVVLYRLPASIPTVAAVRIPTRVPHFADTFAVSAQVLIRAETDNALDALAAAAAHALDGAALDATGLAISGVTVAYWAPLDLDDNGRPRGALNIDLTARKALNR